MLDAPTTRLDVTDVEDENEPIATENVEDSGSDVPNESSENSDVDNKSTNENDYDNEEYKKAWDKIDLDEDLDKYYEEPPDDASNVTNEQQADVTEQVESNAEFNNTTSNNDGLLIPKPILNFRGKEVPVTTPDEMIALAQKGLLLELEMQKIKPQKRIVKLVEDANLSEEDIQAVVDLSKGNSGALDFLANRFNIQLPSNDFSDDIFSSRESEKDNTQQQTAEYKPEVVPDDPVKNFWDEFVQTNPSLSGKVFDIYNSLEETFKNEVYKDNIFQNFVEAVEMGEFEKAYPSTVRIKATNPAATWLQAYSMAVQQLQQGGSSVPANATKEPPAAAAVKQDSVRDKAPTSERDISKKVWADDKYADELMAKLFD
jgi:hypothetical protein